MSLHLSATIMETLAHISPDAIIGVDPQGCVDLWSSAAERLFGLRSEEAIGKPLPVSIATFNTLRGGAGVSQIATITPDGRTLELEVRYSPREASGWVL